MGGRGGPCFRVAQGHVSIRKYRPEPVGEDDINTILDAARRAPSSWNLQPVTVTVVTDPGLRRRVAEAVGGQEHVAEAPAFLVFSVDYYKVLAAARSSGVDPATPGLVHLMTALIDVGIAAAWAGLAAEELGYGVAYIAVYANPCGVAEILGLPPLVLPVVGLCVGRPAESPPPRPRQPREVFASTNSYPRLPLEEVARATASPFGERAHRLYNHVLAPGGYYDSLVGPLVECARRRGFNL